MSIGRSRSGLPEGVCEKAVASQRPGDGATTAERRAAVSCSRKGNEFSQSPVPTPTGYALTVVQLSAVEFVAENVSRRIPLAINPLKPPEKDASAPVGKMAMAQISARAENANKAMP